MFSGEFLKVFTLVINRFTSPTLQLFRSKPYYRRLASLGSFRLLPLILDTAFGFFRITSVSCYFPVPIRFGYFRHRGASHSFPNPTPIGNFGSSRLSRTSAQPLPAFSALPRPHSLPSALSAAHRKSCLCLSPPRDMASASQFPLPPRLSSRLSLLARLGRAAILCEFLTAAGAGQLGHLDGLTRQSARLRGPFPLLKTPLFLNRPRSLSSSPLSPRLLHHARPALITPNHPPVSVSPGSPTPGPAGVRVCVCRGRLSPR